MFQRYILTSISVRNERVRSDFDWSPPGRNLLQSGTKRKKKKKKLQK